LELLRIRDFRLILAAFALSSVGDLLAMMALTLRVHDTTHSGMAVAALMVAGMVPLVLLAPLAGLVVDRFETVKVLVGAAAFQAAVAVGLAFANGLPAIVVLVFALGAGWALEGPAIFALLPRVTGEGRMTEGNAYLETARSAGAALGPLLGGGLVAGLGTKIALLGDAGTFVVLAAAALALKVRRPPESGGSHRVGEPAREQAREGMRFILRHRLLLLVAVVVSAMVLFAAIQNVAEVFFVKDVMHGGDAGYGGLMGTWMVGMLIGNTLIAGRITTSKLARAVLVAPVIGGLVIVVLAWLPSMPLAVVIFIIGGAANGVENVAGRSMIHHTTPDRLRGRVFSATFGLINAASLAAMGLGGVLVALVGPRSSMLLSGVGATAVAIAGLGLYFRIPARERAVGELPGD